MSLATLDDVKAAGNFSSKVDDATLWFYLEIADYFVKEMIGDDEYAEASTETYDQGDLSRLVKAEALMTVGLCLPALFIVTAGQGVLKTFSASGSWGIAEGFSYVKEIEALAASFVNMAQHLISDKVISDNYESFWSNVLTRMFPALNEMPTVADIHSTDEEIIQNARGVVVTSGTEL